MARRVPLFAWARLLPALALLPAPRTATKDPQPPATHAAQPPPDPKRRRLWLLAPTDCTELAEIRYCARELHRAEDRSFIDDGVKKTFERAEEILGDAADPDAQTKAAVQVLLAQRAKRLRIELEERVDQASRKRYAWGLILSVAASMVLLFVLYLLSLWVINSVADAAEWARDRPTLASVLVCIGGGAAGAMVSVLVRLSGRGEPLPNIGILAGVYRVALGWFFAGATIFLIKGGIIGVLKEPDVQTSGYMTNWFFWGGVGFIAGFNERWARNLFTRDPSSDPPVKHATTAGGGRGTSSTGATTTGTASHASGSSAAAGNGTGPTTSTTTPTDPTKS